MMLQALLNLAVGFLVDSVVGSPSALGHEFRREMHRYLDHGRSPGDPTSIARHGR